MSDRRFDMSGLQITASVLAAVTGAVLASYLGVAGTIIGTAVMSVAGTAGTAVYKHFLGRTAGHLKETAKVAAAHRAAEWMTVGTRTAAAHGQAAGKPVRAGPPEGTGTPRDNGASADTAASGSPDASRRADTAGGAAATGDTAAGDMSAAEGTGATGDSRTAPAGGPIRGDGAPPRAGWLARWRATVLGWPPWLKLAAASAVVFVGVIGAVSVVEVAAGKPLQSVVWNHKASGTTLGNLVGGKSSRTTRPARPHSSPSRTAPSSPAPASTRTGSASPTPSPSSSSPSPSPSTATSSPPVSSSPSPSATPPRPATHSTG